MTGGSAFPPIGDLPYLLTLPAYGFYWFELAPATASTKPRVADPPARAGTVHPRAHRRTRDDPEGPRAQRVRAHGRSRASSRRGAGSPARAPTVRSVRAARFRRPDEPGRRGRFTCCPRVAVELRTASSRLFRCRSRSRRAGRTSASCPTPSPACAAGPRVGPRVRRRILARFRRLLSSMRHARGTTSSRPTRAARSALPATALAGR